MPLLNETHDPGLTSWVASANDGRTDFPIQNLPFAVFRRQGSGEAWRGGVAIGDRIVDLAAAVAAGVFTDEALAPARAAAGSTLNDLMGLGPKSASALRHALSKGLRTGATEEAALSACLVPQAQAEYQVPARIGDYTDFYTSVHHATNIGKQFRPDNPLLPNYKWVPIGYHGRSSSIGVSGQSFRRPHGQAKAPDADAPVVRPSQRMDIELEMGVFIGAGNALGEPVGIGEAESRIFGLVLLNDWSARDIQPWEYQPLGPFLAKNFATTVSPWVVTLEALAPFRAPFTRPENDPQPLPYLSSDANRAEGGLDIQLEALIQTPVMREQGAAPARLALTNYRHAYWTAAQMVTHHTVNGCNLQPGDLLGTGTLSGPTLDQACALIELTCGGKHPIALPNGEQRAWLEDGDTVVLRGWCERPGATRIGFGECVGTVLPAV
ncbi:fumarylacetoacetase [Ottowia sp.]|uniref:fumarylacetoacetase n=1 Tax=Ottowia sp. TaxID=1898956 RepID=UPI0025E650BA|nr:fumarylacetoacetase [Ottowia sp.]MBK6613762.1 fumarylacetoacetase [Ottowia sp.]MBK6748359.1 fumarylacetoacetase [Ottowia sp.]